MSLSWFPFSFFLWEKITSPRNSTWCLQNTTFWDNFLIFRAESMFCSVLVCNVKWIDLWKIEPQIFSALEIVPRPKLGERFRKYSRAFQPLWWRSLCLREFKRDSSPNNILLCHVKTSLDKWQPCKKIFPSFLLKNGGIIWRICGFEEMLRVCRLKGKDKAKVNVLYFSRFVWTAEEFINLSKIRYKIPGGQMTTSPCPWEPGNLGKIICLKSAIRNHEKQKIKGK